MEYLFVKVLRCLNLDGVYKLIPALEISEKVMFFSVSSSVRYKTAHALCFGGVSGLAVCLSSHIKNIENNPDTNKVKKNLSFAHFYDSSVLASALRFKAIHYMNSNVPFSYGIPQVNRHALFYLLESGGCKLAEARIYRFFNDVSNLSVGLKKFLVGLWLLV